MNRSPASPTSRLAFLCAAAIAAGALTLGGAGPGPAPGMHAPAPDRGARAPDAELTSRAWLGEVMRHLYRWHIDERDIDPVIAEKQITFWVRQTNPALDEADHSLFGEVLLPQFSILVKAKRADYQVPELDATVKSERFRITGAERVERPATMPEGFTQVRFEYAGLREELFRTRHNASFPEGELLERLRTSVRAQIAKDMEHRGQAAPVVKGTQVVYLAPLSPIANEAWVFWETGRTLIRFASDIDLTNPAVWAHEKLAVRLFSLDEKVVVSLDEVAGSNAFMTRDEAGRAMFNCIVLGKRIELEPKAEAGDGGK